MKQLFIDTHNQKEFGIGLFNNNEYQYLTGNDASANLLANINKINQDNDIDEIYFIKGPGSLTSLRIGSSTALGLALGIKKRLKKEVAIKSLAIWDVLLEELPEETEIFFHTGTKKWIKKTQQHEEMVESLENNTQNWTTNNFEKASLQLSPQNYQPYPTLIMQIYKYTHKASNDLSLIYPVTNFVK